MNASLTGKALFRCIEKGRAAACPVASSPSGRLRERDRFYEPGGRLRALSALRRNARISKLATWQVFIQGSPAYALSPDPPGLATWQVQADEARDEAMGGLRGEAPRRNGRAAASVVGPIFGNICYPLQVPNAAWEEDDEGSSGHSSFSRGQRAP